MGYRIMIVDDSCLLREILGGILSKEGYEVIEADSGAVAIKLYYQYKPEIILLDINLPDMSGLTVMEIINGIDPFAYIIMITAYSRVEHFNACLVGGARDFIIKPFSKARILEAVEKGLTISNRLKNINRSYRS